MMPDMLEVGTEAPSFTALDQDGQAVSLDDYRGKWVLQWWYVKASTAG